MAKGRTVVLQHFLAFYLRRRKLFTRSACILILYFTFNSGSSSKRRRKHGVSNKNKRYLSADVCTFKNPFTRLVYKLKHSPTVLLFSRLAFAKRKNTSKILSYFGAQMALLVAKAIFTLKEASLDGALVSSMVSKEFRQFFKFLAFWLLLGIPSSITSSLIKKCQGMLAESIRESITESILDDYLPDSGNSTLYQMVNQSRVADTSTSSVLSSKSASTSPDRSRSHSLTDVTNPNNIITTTVEELSQSMAILPFQLFDPILDIMLAGNRLSEVSKYASEGSLLLGVVANISTLLLKVFTPNFAALSSTHNTLENMFHTYHSQIIDHREEIALSRGHRRELDMLDASYFESERFQRLEMRRMAVYNFAVGFIFKYGLGAFGLMLCSFPVFTTAYLANFQIERKLVAKLASDFFANRRLLMSASDSLGRLILSKKTINNSIGYSTSLWEFDSILKDINNASKNVLDDHNDDRLISGPNVSYGNEISFVHVPLVTPSGNVLAEDLNFSIKPGQNMLVIGPNGCGKSSLFRILGGLWEVLDPGKVTVPSSRRDLFYLPQRSYLTYGSLREQILYPDSMDDYRLKLVATKKSMGSVVKDDNYLIDLLQLVHLEYLLGQNEDEDSKEEDTDDDDIETYSIGSSTGDTEKLSGLDAVKKWPDLLSVGEQQRLALARLYYHQPKFAVLDECTSSISPDLEKECYRMAIERFGITVLSVCHRTSLWQFHSYILKFNRQDDVAAATTIFTKFDPDKRLKRHQELIEVEAALKKDDDLTTRLESLKKMQLRGGRRAKLMYIGDD
ncbi:hypothetical protein FOA43_004578 [Brettanomyces nanus]|uniref:ABC transporter domain-containing protein n=1 Tax=Eeniella nana TaxID=13502 RepID=A0A875SBT5_EENNA|nr:uncharacterized protein FOA43_004578 [Brettanomyces nanus]QPG77172.1 hypothetical protein FOA43_004578 [Brettanomyces nanus]